jgi:hypothetical protein
MLERIREIVARGGDFSSLEIPKPQLPWDENGKLR